MKKTIIVLLMLSISYICTAQNDNKLMRWDSKVFEGVWLAKSGTKEYELTLKREKVYLPGEGYFTEMILGCIIYSENGKVIRTTVIDGNNSLLVYGDMFSNKRQLGMLFRDRLLKMSGLVSFELKTGDDTIASWSNKKTVDEWNIFPDWNKGTYNIPTTLEFKKIK